MAKQPALTPEEARAEALGTALSTIERKYGKGAVMKLSDDAHVQIPVIPTGSIGLDLALGVGGIPRGRVTEIFGPESSGKTTLTLHIIAECQKQGGTCAFVDAEHALDVNYARRLGVNTDELLISQPDYGEQALDIADRQRPRVKAHAADSALVHSLSLLRNGNIAVCTSSGFWICTPGLGVVSRPSERHNVICAAELPDGTILLSTNGHGMLRQSHGKSLGLPKALRAIDSYALNMAWGPDSSLWMVTDDKLMRYSFGEDRLDVFGAADFGENLTFSESQCCILQDSLLYVGAIPGMMKVDVKAIDRYVEARDDGGGTKPWHGAIAVAAAVATALGAALACKRRKKAKAAPQRYGVAPAKPEVVGADTAFVARLNSVLNSVIADADADIDSIASSMNMTRNMLFQRCSETLGATPAALLQRMRMERACQLFDAGERRVKEVAWQTGFNDPKYFAKVFKKTKGMTPTQYVENQREKGGK